jgi:outer membrane immunogenic protein
MRLIYAAALLAAASSSPAFAQTFDGFSIAALGGVDHVTGPGDSATGFAYGVGAGYDVRSGGAAFGFQLEAADATTRECSATGCLDAGRDLYAGLRGGAVFGPADRNMIYGLVGYSNARVQLVNLPGHIDLDGIRVGLGYEHQPGPKPNWFFRLEGRYTNYELGFERWQGIAGVGFRF